uniref:Large ribosomal subunit protein mL49 n=1 Tax=Chaetoceros debilis TaxID=122233 RepID=A0A7S3PVA7_9STRA|mmetsp:Transcript_4198/g.6146  ORF Transcript_4198/g.6146 Transcript_4198/m.6146 type:complete len:180 (+) Transcript_4198:114-653(+)|eukprot:CAMPEP_0194075616 /NCGR_PEP_ID=MMETSP0149-20130528/2581_1 /TAXON_ID=122233 /ORGANISM="Chaetoceros debilis, Strain MM31A-1" /LENGTH=179 /DNA_ID=CAMNT_0038756141 /DNA_START=69 /DNA_END=608 /DNA_ORIENTATION=-
MISSLNALSRSAQRTNIISRGKHSKTQIKRIFKNNPAYIRVASRNNSLPKYSAPPAITYNAVFTPNILPNGWCAPPTDDGIIAQRNEIPFGVRRTGNKPNGAVGFLPVYSSVRLGGTKHTTIIKKVSGDKDLFLNELRANLGVSPDDSNSIITRASGTTIEVNGNRVREVKTWLAGLGF